MITIHRDAEIFDTSQDWFQARWHSARTELILVDVPMQFEPAGVWKGRI